MAEVYAHAVEAVQGRTAWARRTATLRRRKASSRRPDIGGTRVEQRNGPEATLLGTAPWTGKTLAEVAFERELSFEDVLIDVIGPDGASAAYFVVDDELQARLIRNPFVAVASDGRPYMFHPRGYGSFAKVIEEQVVAERRLPLPEAVRKNDLAAGAHPREADRGTLAEGMAADVVVFEPQRVRALAGYTAPHRYAEGFEVVIVNGAVTRVNGELTGTLAGRVLYAR